MTGYKVSSLNFIFIKENEIESMMSREQKAGGLITSVYKIGNGAELNRRTSLAVGGWKNKRTKYCQARTRKIQKCSAVGKASTKYFGKPYFFCLFINSLILLLKTHHTIPQLMHLTYKRTKFLNEFWNLWFWAVSGCKVEWRGASVCLFQMLCDVENMRYEIDAVKWILY